MRRALLLAIVCFALAVGCSGSKGTTSPTQPPPAGTNHNPAVSINTSATTLNYGGQATITVQASDIDGDQLTLAYSATGGTIAASGPTATTATFTAGNHYGPASAKATVSDGKGGSTAATASMYIRNPDPPHFTFGETSSSSCGSGTANPNGFVLTITAPEAVTLTGISIGEGFCGTCGTSRNYYDHPIAVAAGQTYTWSDGGCLSNDCCLSTCNSGCYDWDLIISGSRPAPDGGSFYYECKHWDPSNPQTSCP